MIPVCMAERCCRVDDKSKHTVKSVPDIQLHGEVDWYCSLWAGVPRLMNSVLIGVFCKLFRAFWTVVLPESLHDS